MAKRKPSIWGRMNPANLSLDLDDGTKKGVWIVVLFFFGAVSILALLGRGGQLGVWLQDLLSLAFGWASWLFPVTMLTLSFFLFQDDKYEVRVRNYFGLALFITALTGLVFIFFPFADWQRMASEGIGGGYVGYNYARFWYWFAGFEVTFVLLLCQIVLSTIIMFNADIHTILGRDSMFMKAISVIGWPLRAIMNGRTKDEDEEAKADESEEEEKEAAEEEEPEEEEKDAPEEEEEEGEAEDEGDDGEQEEATPWEERKIATETAARAAGTAKPRSWWEPLGFRTKFGTDLLSSKSGKAQSGDIKFNIETIARTLKNFGIVVEMGDVSVGPTVTQYTFKPAEGIKLSRITALSNDLALALAAHPIRIEAPIPGKSLVGVEVPNQTKAIVNLKDNLESHTFREAKSRLNFALGKDVSGHDWSYDLGRLPHLLVAGATGSGKSVCLNAIISSLLYQNDPDDLRFIMVDPKRVELTLYDGIPHLLAPVITDVKRTVNSLHWCLNEMDRRLDLISAWRVKDIGSFNALKNPKAGHLPYIVFIIDELADLMLTSGREIEAGVIRLAQLARAVGIHLILATQRPSVDVITGLIKANMPGRVAFSVASQIDSRTIIDGQGAEKLLGRGDMLFLSPDLSKPKRIQGCYVSDLETKRICNFVRERGELSYHDDVTERQKVHGFGGGGLGVDNEEDVEDEKFDEAVELVLTQRSASASYLQRKLSVGYAKAARFLDTMEKIGIIGPSNGAKKREILMTKEEYYRTRRSGVVAAPLHDRATAEAPEEFLEAEEESEDDDEEDDDNEDEVKDQEDSEDKEDDNVSDDEETEEGEEDKEEEESEDSNEDNKEEDKEEDNGRYFSR